MLIDLKNKDKRTGWIVSLAIHAVVILLFFFIMAWQAPDVIVWNENEVEQVALFPCSIGPLATHNAETGTVS